MAYEMRITNKYTLGNKTYTKDNLSELHEILRGLIIDDCATVKIYEVKEITPEWTKDITKYNSNIHKLSNVAQKLLYEQACISKKF